MSAAAQDTAAQAGTVAVPKRFPLVTQPGFRSTKLTLSDPSVRSPVSDAALINCYAELDPQDKQFWVEKRPGTSTLATSIGAAGGVGMVFTPTTVYPVAIFGSNIYQWVGGVLTNIAYEGSSNPLIPGRLARFLPVPKNDFGGPGVGAWAANGGLWIVSVGAAGGHYAPGYLAAQDFITGGPPWGATPLCDGVVYLDGVMYVMDQNGAIWGSNAGAFNTWLATTVIQAGGRYDPPVCLAQQLEYIIAFKGTSLRCFYDAGAAAQTDGVGSNLAWIEGADANYGCANAGTVQLIDETLLWVSNNDKSTPQIARMDGLQVKVVSTPPVERLLQQLLMAAYSAAPSATTNILYSSGIKRGGHRWYTLTATSVCTGGTPFTLVYDLDQELWFVWTSPGSTYWSPVGASAHSDYNAGVFAQDISSGALYMLDIDQIYPTDSGTPCQVDIYTPNWDGGTRRRKMLNMLYFVNDQVSGSKMQVRKSDDDYRSWSPLRDVRLDVAQPWLDTCGTFRRRTLNIRHNAATPFRIKTGDAQIDLGVL